MPDLISLAIFAGASLIALAIPGPTIALVITRALTQGRRVSVPMALGVGLGTLVGSVVALTGAGALLAASATAFTLVKWIGAGYLIYLGIKMLRTPVHLPSAEPDLSGVSAFEGLRDGFLVTLLNPKSIAFAAAFIPQFITPEGGYVVQAAVLVALYTALATGNALAFALGTDALRQVVRSVGVLRWANRCGGAIMVAAGCAGLFAKRPVG
ncbi:LysE family translocator [Pseudaestuariivita sp.]|uniref:LysE family translocator n=1 Tax=Pseudaestuariivita sp. TaxID=2211669 RepID=UPI0040595737